MKYELLKKYYYTNKEAYDFLYKERINNPDMVRLGISINGNMAFYLPCNEVNTLINSILRVDKKITLLETNLPETAISQFRMDSLINEIIITNSIEGIHSTRREITDVISSIGTNNRKDNKFEGLVKQQILLGQNNIKLVTCEDVRRLYDELVLDEVIANNPNNTPDGELFRKDAVDVINPMQQTIHTGIYPEEKIIEYLSAGLSLLNNESIDNLIRTSVFHYLFGYIHPFYDGNGRVSRFISSYYLSQDLDSLIGNRLSYTIQENINNYYKMFKVCNDPINKGDLTPFIIMFLGIVLEAEQNLLYALEKRRNIYVECLDSIEFISSSDKWDKTTEDVCIELLITSLFSNDGFTKKELSKSTEIGFTTLEKRLDVLNKYDIVVYEKQGVAYNLKLDYKKLLELKATRKK